MHAAGGHRAAIRGRHVGANRQAAHVQPPQLHPSQAPRSYGKCCLSSSPFWYTCAMPNLCPDRTLCAMRRIQERPLCGDASGRLLFGQHQLCQVLTGTGWVEVLPKTLAWRRWSSTGICCSCGWRAALRARAGWAGRCGRPRPFLTSAPATPAESQQPPELRNPSVISDLMNSSKEQTPLPCHLLPSASKTGHEFSAEHA